ncbi:hypothetical protein PMAYCL1PPCAC_03664 [Pristionchus mayeri]|uniref:GST C-terminal domain-containing protein n=1 Tax=Pristionchus mayeri TaxID=1317129 RepID=A0AAN5C954_9BILA|nr:hypothetical protein PMAYCL1PPCAC_03664 [Pristionchus mayeri]
MEGAGPSGHGYLHGLQGLDESLNDPSLLYPHFASLTSMAPMSSSLDSSSSFNPHHFLFASQSPSRLFSPYREMDWLERPLREVDPSMAVDETMGLSRMMNEGASPRKRTWSDRIANESKDKKYQRMERNRIRMAEKRARETDEEKRARLESVKHYMKRRHEEETEEQAARRKEINRVRTAIRRGKLAVERSLDDQLQSMMKAGRRSEAKEESEEERNKRLELAREYASSRRRRETPEQKAERQTKNRERMRALRASKKEQWQAFLTQRESIEDRLQLMRMQFGEKSPLLETDSMVATRLAELLRELAAASRKKRGGRSDVTVRDWDVFLVSRLPPILTALEDLLASGETGNDGVETFVFGAEVSYLDYLLYEELEALCVLSPNVLDSYPTLRGHRERFQQAAHLTTCALMHAGSTLNLACDSADDQSPTVPLLDPLETQPLLMTFDEV